MSRFFWLAVAPTSYLFHLTSAIFRLPSSLSNPKVIRASDISHLPSSIFLIKSEGHPRQFTRSFFSPVGEKNFSRGGANFYLHWRCKGTKNPDAKQAFFKFFSDLFQVLKCKIMRNSLPSQWHSYAATQRHKQNAIASKLFSISYIIILYIIIYNIIINITPSPNPTHRKTLWRCVAVSLCSCVVLIVPQLGEIFDLSYWKGCLYS